MCTHLAVWIDRISWGIESLSTLASIEQSSVSIVVTSGTKLSLLSKDISISAGIILFPPFKIITTKLRLTGQIVHAIFAPYTKQCSLLISTQGTQRS